MDNSQITLEQVGQLVAEQFPQFSDLPLRTVKVNGWDNTTFRLGEAYSVRLPNGDGYVAQVQKEHRWLPALAPRLTLPIPEPLALGRPTDVFPRPWSIYRWIDGEVATSETVADMSRLARDLASFLNAMYAIPPDEAAPRPDRFHLRGGPLERLDAWTRSALAACKGELDTRSALAAWDRSLGAPSNGSEVWVHGDVAATNLLVRDGNLTAVIDFGCLAVGDPACDLMIAWTFLDRESRAVFRQTLDIDSETWERGRGWALWKAALVLEDELTGAGRQPHWQRMGWTCDAKSVIKRVLTE